uniref:Uncharacterized protein n=1 Tax=Nicotiana tabacum TaxID=4097 RepID=A0A1S4CF15_TOBAC|nr:PREDICTED: uncharacterized protein LOC107818268 [Nicotiana tabacum]
MPQFTAPQQTMVKSKGGSEKQKGKAESSRGRGRGQIKLTPAIRKSIGQIRKNIRVADRAASHSEGSEYVPSREASETDSMPTHVADFPRRFHLTDEPTPLTSPASPTTSESSDGSAEIASPML